VKGNNGVEQAKLIINVNEFELFYTNIKMPNAGKIVALNHFKGYGQS
jgi:fructose-1,6-bisphosphatase